MQLQLNKLAIITLSAFAIGLAGCEVQKTQEGKLPDVEVKDGQIPKYDVIPPDVKVTTDPATVKVPTDVDVKTEEKTIDVPKVEVTPAPETDPAKPKP